MYEAEVARGAAWLDEVAPGWERKIDLSVLNLDSCRQCVCGQVFAEQIGWCDGFRFALNEMADDWALSSQLGFSLGSIDDWDKWDDLGQAWVHLIKERFDSGTLSDQAIA
jgi:hypothetical protein